MRGAKRKTNEEIVIHMMKFSKYGALRQLFIVQAIQEYARMIADSNPPEGHERSIIHWDAWQGVARECLRDLEAMYKQNEEAT